MKTILRIPHGKFTKKSEQLNKKEVWIFAIRRIFPIFVASFYHRIAHNGILTAPPGFVRAVFLLSPPVVWVPRPDLFGQFRPFLAHIIIHVQFAVKSRFHLSFYVFIGFSNRPGNASHGVAAQQYTVSEIGRPLFRSA